MNEREKKLLRILAGVFVAVLGWKVFDSFVAGPLGELDAQISAARTGVEQQQEKKFELDTRKRQIALWEHQSLGPDAGYGRGLYHEWLRNQAEISGWSNLAVDLGQQPSPPAGRPFVPVPITLTAEASLEQVARFLAHFERIDLLHRVKSLALDSPSNEGNPPLKVTLVAEGLCVPSAPRRTTLFATTKLTSRVDGRAESVQVGEARGFPTVTPFQVRIDTEYLTVTAINKDRWIVTRGAAETRRASHDAGAAVEFCPQRRADAPEQVLAAYAAFLKPGPFTKVAESGPMRFRPIARQQATRGSEWTLRPELINWDTAALGTPEFRVDSDAPGGVEVDARGTLRWTPARDAPDGPFQLTLVATASREAAVSVETRFQVSVRDPNSPPKLTPLAEQRAFIGRPLEFAVRATDPDSRSRLSYTMQGGPRGARLDPRSGRFEWTPGSDAPLGEQTVRIRVSDDGSPPLTDEIAVKLQVADDPSELTFFVGYVEQGDDRVALLHDWTTNESRELREGETVDLADVEAEVVSVRRDHIILRVGTERFRLERKQNLRQAAPVKGDRWDR
jgi:hypothetical protein